MPDTPKFISMQEIPHVSQFAQGDDGSIHVFSVFHDAWCDGLRIEWDQEIVERYETMYRPKDPLEDVKDEICHVCFAVDEETAMQVAEGMWG